MGMIAKVTAGRCPTFDQKKKAFLLRNHNILDLQSLDFMLLSWYISHGGTSSSLNLLA